MEVSQRTDSGEVSIAPSVEGLPALRVPPGSLIRLPIHARRRDEDVEHADRAFPDLPDEAIEEPLLQMWPSSEAQVWHRLGSRETMRRQWDDRSRDEEPG